MKQNKKRTFWAVGLITAGIATVGGLVVYKKKQKQQDSEFKIVKLGGTEFYEALQPQVESLIVELAHLKQGHLMRQLVLNANLEAVEFLPALSIDEMVIVEPELNGDSIAIELADGILRLKHVVRELQNEVSTSHQAKTLDFFEAESALTRALEDAFILKRDIRHVLDGGEASPLNEEFVVVQSWEELKTDDTNAFDSFF